MTKRTTKRTTKQNTPTEEVTTPTPTEEVSSVLTFTQLGDETPVGNLPVAINGVPTPEPVTTPDTVTLTDTDRRNLTREYGDCEVKLERAVFLVNKSIRCIEKAITDTAKKNTDREEGKSPYTVEMIAYWVHHNRMLPKHVITRNAIVTRMNTITELLSK